MIPEKIYGTQREFNKRFWPPNVLTEEDAVRLTKEYILHMVSECDEVLREMKWKLHRPGEKVVVKSNLLEEVIDIYKYWLSIAQVWGFSDYELEAEFWRKSEVVEQRYQQEIALAETKRPLAIIDIDGVLADYPASFVSYVARSTGTSLPSDNGTYENLVEGLSRIEVVRWKRRYREEGFEGQHVAVMPDAQYFLRCLQESGLFLCVVTARPYWHYKRMFADTLRWFTNNRLPFDAIIFAEDKQSFLLDLIDQGKTIDFAVEDHPGQARSIASLSIPVILLDRPYNLGATFDSLPVVRVKSLTQIIGERNLA